jgi:peptide-methionine (S)-S-oxide reductase
MLRILIAPILIALASGPALAEEPFIIPAPTQAIEEGTSLASAVFGAGCFWGVQGVFQHVEGVVGAVSGYAGGTAETASYDLVARGMTDHAEAVEITYDPSIVSYGELLHILFSVVHDPTQLNYQGPDHGPQYRSAIFPLTPEQEDLARAYIAELDATGVYADPIVTTIEDLDAFYAAEEYHQDFLTRYPDHPYIVRWDLPKLENLAAVFPDNFRAEPMLVLAAN